LNTGGEHEGTNDLVETNRNLSAAVDKMEMRCKVLEEKNEKLKKYKRMVKNSTALQCLHCAKFISCNIFLQHIINCVNMNAGMAKTNLINTVPQTPTNPYTNNSTPNHNTYQDNTVIDAGALQISINQTMVKENSDSKPYTEYLIQVSYNGIKWSVSRKYKMFCELHQNLNTHFPSLKFPESAFTILGAFNNINYMSNSKRPTVIEERRKALQQYLRDLAKIDIVRNSSPFKKFLELDRVLEGEGSAEKINKNIANTLSTINSYREEKRVLVSNLNSERNTEEYTNFNAIYPPQKNGDQFNGNGTMTEEMVQQKELGVKIDKRLFTQSPQSFMKNWQERQTTNNKENRNPR
jgi:PX domain.